MRSQARRKYAIRELEKLLAELPSLTDVVVVEGLRDINALRSLGYNGEIEPLCKTGVNDYDIADMIASKHIRVLLLLDYDEEGLSLTNHFTQLLERQGVKVEYGLRKEFGRLMAAIGVYAVESLDNIRDELNQ